MSRVSCRECKPSTHQHLCLSIVTATYCMGLFNLKRNPLGCLGIIRTLNAYKLIWEYTPGANIRAHPYSAAYSSSTNVHENPAIHFQVILLTVRPWLRLWPWPSIFLTQKWIISLRQVIDCTSFMKNPFSSTLARMHAHTHTTGYSILHLHQTIVQLPIVEMWAASLYVSQNACSFLEQRDKF